MPTTTERVDTWEMVLVHRVFRREFRLLTQLIRTVADGDRRRAAILADHLHDLSVTLHHHHEAEDDLLWPVMLDRAGVPHDVVRRMETQHVRLADLLDRVDTILPRWRTGARAEDRDALADAVGQASAAIDEHLTDEENELLPLVRQHVTPAEWAAVGKRGQEAMPKNGKAFVLLGMILEDASAAEATRFLSLLPPPIRFAWRLFGRRVHASAMRRVRGA